MGTLNIRKKARLKRKWRIRKNLTGTSARPRMSVFRSARHIYAQVIDDTSAQTIATASSLEQTVKEHPKFDNKVATATFVGKLLAERAIGQGVRKIVFDRNGFLYHGRVRALSEGARKAGLDF